MKIEIKTNGGNLCARDCPFLQTDFDAKACHMYDNLSRLPTRLKLSKKGVKRSDFCKEVEKKYQILCHLDLEEDTRGIKH